MREKTAWALVAALGLLVVASLSGVVSGGPLDPPGSPGPTMKTLQEVEPRTPISSLPVTISQPGSYYLTGDLTGVSGQNGVTINASDVTLDLNGFTLRGVPGSAFGIDVTGAGGAMVVTVRNGVIRDWGVIGLNGGHAKDSVFEDLQVINNGIVGIVVGGFAGATNNIVRRCIAEDNDVGVRLDNSGLVERCAIRANGNGLESNAGSGGSAFADNEITDNGVGIVILTKNNRIERNHVVNNGAGLPAGVGIRLLVNATGNRVTDNNLIGNGNANTSYGGLRVEDAGNLIVRNTARQNGNTGALHFQVVGGNTVGPSEPGMGTLTNPWANVVY